PEPGFYIVGMKSYGRAPTFLMATGYEQVRSIAAALAGDQQAADDVHLVLPETGVCTTDLGGTCDTPAPATPAPTHQRSSTPANAAPVPPPTRPPPPAPPPCTPPTPPTRYLLGPAFPPPPRAAPAPPPPQPPPPPQTTDAAPQPTLHRCCSPPQWLPAANPPTTRSAQKRSQQPLSSAQSTAIAEASLRPRTTPALRGPL